jgi:hypothetical protein
LRGRGDFEEPYIEAIGRHDDYYRYVLGNSSMTTAGELVLQATVEVVVAESPLTNIYARVREGNRTSHQMFDRQRFDRLRRDAFSPPTIQIIRQRHPAMGSPPPLPPNLYVPHRRLVIPSGCRPVEHRLAA